MTTINHTVVYEGEDGAEQLVTVSFYTEDGSFTEIHYHPDAKEWQEDVAGLEEKVVRVPTDRIIKIEDH